MASLRQGVYIPTTDLAYGELFAYNYAASGPGAGELTPIKIVGFPNATDFHTLGLEYDEPTSTLFVTNHAQAGPRVEIFKLDLSTFVATHVQTLVHPLITIPNSIQLLGSHELYLSNDHYFPSRLHPILSKLETFLGFPWATVVHLTLDTADYSVKTARVVARQAFANGVVLFEGGRTLAVASSSGGAVHLYDVAADRSLALRKKIYLPYLPDNVELKDDSTLLITGHPHMPTLTKWVESRHICHDDEALAAASEDQKRRCEEGTNLSWVTEWSEEGGLRSLFVESIYGSSATTVFDKEAGFGLIAGLYAKGLFTWRE